MHQGQVKYGRAARRLPDGCVEIFRILRLHGRGTRAWGQMPRFATVTVPGGHISPLGSQRASQWGCYTLYSVKSNDKHGARGGQNVIPHCSEVRL